MSDKTPNETPNDGPVETGSKPETDWERRRRIAAVFGDVLPDTTTDERDSGDRRPADGDTAGDDWLKAQVPPHHGG